MRRLISTTIKLMTHPESAIEVKMKSLELLAAFLYKGFAGLIVDTLTNGKPEVTPFQFLTSLLTEEYNSSYSLFSEAQASSVFRVRKALSLEGMRAVMISTEEF